MNSGLEGHVSVSGEAAFLRKLSGQPGWKKRPPVIFDVGANVGDYSLTVVDAIPQVALFSFEPTQSAYQQLTARLGPRATCFPIGLSSSTQAAKIFSASPGSSRSSLYPIDATHRGMGAEWGNEAIQLTSLDAFCRENQINHIDLLKLDVEGHELEVLKGAEEMLSRGAIDIIQFEFGGCNIASRTFIKDFMRLLGTRYRLFKLFKNGLWQVPAYHELLEIFDTSNWIAVREGIDVPKRF